MMHKLKKPLNENLAPGNTYRVEYKGAELYDASVVSYDGGCWATVKVENVLPSPNEKIYRQGQTFDLKVAQYKFFELEASDKN
ncbi:MAG: hypothetical protein JSS63_14480 [Bacteroidetes bacterium]|nr:hypothetical protein [Bacteroidota bacterium]MBX7047452.1 hypothetical protein [Ignavibacteria bacterium]